MAQSRNTQQRQLVRSLLLDNHSHPTADEVYELARKVNPTISRGTVYRNLNQLVEGGELSRIKTPVGPDHYDFVLKEHYHFLCRACGRVLDTAIPYEKPGAEVPGLEGCRLETYELMLTGLCPDCNR